MIKSQGHIAAIGAKIFLAIAQEMESSKDHQTVLKALDELLRTEHEMLAGAFALRELGQVNGLIQMLLTVLLMSKGGLDSNPDDNDDSILPYLEDIDRRLTHV